MGKLIKQLVQMFWRIVRGKDPFGFEIPPMRESQPNKRRKENSPYYIGWHHTGIGYECWGCKRKEFLPLVPKPTHKDEVEFRRRWGRSEDSIKLIFLGDGSYSAERFCPDCQETIKLAAKRDRFGYLASELAALLREPEEKYTH